MHAFGCAARPGAPLSDPASASGAGGRRSRRAGARARRRLGRRRDAVRLLRREQAGDEVVAAHRDHGARVAGELLGDLEPLQLEVVVGGGRIGAQPLVELGQAERLGLGLELEGLVTRLLLERDQVGAVVQPALFEREVLLLLGQLDRGEPPRLERRGDRIREHDPRERDVPDPDPVRLELGVDRGAQERRLGGPEIERGQRLDAADQQADGLLAGGVDELVEVARRDRVGELDRVLDAERQHEVDVDVDAVRRADRRHRDVERDLAGRDDVGQREERVDPVHAGLPDRVELVRAGGRGRPCPVGSA